MTPENLKTERLSMAKSVEDMADILRYPLGTYIKYEYGQRPLPGDIEWRIALVTKDQARLAALLLDQTEAFNWNPEQEVSLGMEVSSLAESRRLDQGQAFKKTLDSSSRVK